MPTRITEFPVQYHRAWALTPTSLAFPASDPGQPGDQGSSREGTGLGVGSLAVERPALAVP